MYDAHCMYRCVVLAHIHKQIHIQIHTHTHTHTHTGRARIPSTEHKLAIVLGKKYTAAEAKAAGIINEVCSLERLQTSAIAAANRLAGDGLDRKTLAALKHDLHRDIVQNLKEPVRFYSLL